MLRRRSAEKDVQMMQKIHGTLQERMVFLFFDRKGDAAFWLSSTGGRAASSQVAKSDGEPITDIRSW